MQLAKARTVASDKRPYIRQRLFRGSAPSPALVPLPLVVVVLPRIAIALLPVAVALQHASGPAVPFQALGARLCIRLHSDQPLCFDDNARRSDRVETQVTAMESAGDLI